MRKILLTTMLAAAIATPALASPISEGAILGTTIEEVRAAAADLGYEVRKAEMEDGLIEVYLVSDQALSEVYVDPQTGRVVRVKTR